MSDDTTERFERLEQETKDLENVVGAAREGEAGVPVVLVTEKKPERELPDDQIIGAQTTLAPDEHDVIEVGDLIAEPNPDPDPDPGSDFDLNDGTDDVDVADVRVERRARRDPVPAGAEESPDGMGWVGTGGPLARVTDTSVAGTRWSDSVSEGDTVRLSNWHVYNGGEFNEGHQISQPHRGRQVGEVVGGVPLSNGISVDVAARSVSGEDGWGVVDLPGRFGRGVRTDTDLVGETVTKSGRTTGVTSGRVRAVGANVRIRYSSGSYRIEDTIIADRMSAGGDSGSAVYIEDSGDLVGLHFAGSPKASVSVRMANVMDSLGVEPITDWHASVPPIEYPAVPDPPNRDAPSWWPFDFPFPFAWWPDTAEALSQRLGSEISEYDFESLVEAYFVSEFGEQHVDRQHYFPEMVRYADLMVETPVGDFAIEIERSIDAAIRGVGQCLIYAGPRENSYPMVILPEGAAEGEEIELEFLRRTVPILEFPAPDAVE